MKSKKTTYLLLAVVLIIWSIILCKLLFPNKDKESSEVLVSVLEHEIAGEKDSLKLNYRDPFFGTVIPMAIVQEENYVGEISSDKKRDPKSVDNIFYYGRITNRKQMYCLISIDNKQYVMKEGDVESDFKLLQIYEDSVHFWKDGDIYCIRLE